ncbi:MAG: hypothetical protein GXP56_11500 [Deltaproteobacteria bacterium]|nr:hypothetical protein [Deltaproteobacteria bacterium]
MILLFLKILFAGIFLVSLWICFKKVLVIVHPLWTKQQSLGILKPLINNNIYDAFTINRSIKPYVPPKCQESHPFKKPGRNHRTRIKKKDLIKELDIFMDHDATCRHMLILADSGMGKTCFALNYFIHNFKRPKKERHKIVLVPLGTKKAETLILKPSDKKNSVLFLDGFDEDAKAAGNRHTRLRQIIDLSRKYRKVVITSGINFIPKDKNMPMKTGYERIGPENINENHMYEFKKLYFSPFNQADIKKYLNSHLPIWKISIKKKILSFIENNPIMRINPLLLSFFKDIFKKEDLRLESINEIYEKIIKSRISKDRNCNDKPLLNSFIQRLAADIYLGREKMGEESIEPEELAQKARDWGTILYPPENNKQSLISRTQSGSFKFIHRSVMEYLFIKELVSGNKSCYQTILTDQMGKFLLEMLENNNPINLKMEFHWLSQFELKAHGLSIKQSNDDNGPKPTDLFKTILRQNHRFEFLNLLNSLMQNPIFFEFGWDPNLYKNLKKAIYQSKSSLMKLSKRKWTVMIDRNKIEITKQYKKNKTILINEKDFKEYSKLPDSTHILKLGAVIGLKGLIMLNNINQSKNFTALPNLETFQGFTIYFWTKQFN